MNTSQPAESEKLFVIVITILTRVSPKPYPHQPIASQNYRLQPHSYTASRGRSWKSLWNPSSSHDPCLGWSGNFFRRRWSRSNCPLVTPKPPPAGAPAAVIHGNANGLGKLARNPGASHCCKGIPVFWKQANTWGKKHPAPKVYGSLQDLMLFFTWVCLTFSPFLHRKIERMFSIESAILTLLRFLWIQFFFGYFGFLWDHPGHLKKDPVFVSRYVLGDKPRYFASFNSSRVKPWRFIRWRCFVPRQHGTWTK